MITNHFKVYLVIFILSINLILSMFPPNIKSTNSQPSNNFSPLLLVSNAYAENNINKTTNTPSTTTQEALDENVSTALPVEEDCIWWDRQWWNPFAKKECRIGAVAGSVSVFFAAAASNGVKLIIEMVSSIVLIDPQAVELGNPESHLVNLWNFVRNITNSLFALILLVLAFTHMLRIDVKTYDLKIMLPKFFITIVLVNFSWIIGRIVIDISNVFSVYLLHINDGQFTEIIENFDYTGVTRGQTFVGGVFMLILLVIIYTLGFIMALFLLLQLVFRVVIIQILLVLSPIAFACNLLPFTKKIYSTWWSEFSKWLFMGPITLFLLVLAERSLATYPHFEGSGSTWWLKPVFVAALLFAASTVPSALGGKAMAGLDKFNSGLKNKGKNWAWTGRTDGKGSTGLNKKLGFLDRDIASQTYHARVRDFLESTAGNRLASGNVGVRFGKTLAPYGSLKKEAIDEQQNKQWATADKLAENLNPNDLAATWIENGGKGVKSFEDNQGVIWDARQVANMNRKTFNERFSIKDGWSEQQKMDFDKIRRGAARAKQAIHTAQLRAGEGNTGYSNLLERLSAENYTQGLGAPQLDSRGNVIDGQTATIDNFDVNKARDTNYGRMADVGPELTIRKQTNTNSPGQTNTYRGKFTRY